MSNKEVVSLEALVKSDSSVEQRMYYVREFQRRIRTSITLGGSPTLAGNDHEFISKKYMSTSTRHFGETQKKAIMKTRDS